MAKICVGAFDEENNSVRTRIQQPELRACLLNFAATHTILNGG
jgi:hypothetical protein